MANRILIGNRETGGYGLYVSKSGADVLDCDKANLSFWTDHGESGNAFVAKGYHQLVPTSVSSGGVPVESATINLSQNATAALTYENLGEDVMIMGGFTVPSSAISGSSAIGIKFTSTSSTGATGNRTTSSEGGTFRACVWKMVGKGVALG